MRLAQSKYVAALVALGLLGCGGQKVGEAEHLVRTTLTDGKAARFTEIQVSSKDPEVVCGLVNSKDSSGENVGIKRFYADLRTKQAQVDPQQAIVFESHLKKGGLGIADSAEFERLYGQKC